MSRVLDQFQEASRYLAGGVSSSTRVNTALGHAMYFDRAEGCRIWDLDGREYLDLCTSHGATLLGHGDSRVRAAVEKSLARGFPCSYENEQHAELGRLLCDSIPCLERVRLTGSGSEATMHCLRLARAYSGRTKLLRFQGNFHGYHDQVMLTSRPDGTWQANSTGVPPGLDQLLIEVPYNRPDLVEQVFQQHGEQLGAAILEPVYFNAGCIVPTKEFIQTLRRLCTEYGVVLIFDEVLTAFRMALGGAQEYLGVKPDLCTVGKAVGGGFPLSVFGGRKEIMDRLMPQGDCQHSGTYNGHPVAVAAAVAAIKAYREPSFYPHIQAIANRLYPAIAELLTRFDINGRIQGLGARFGLYFGTRDEVRSFSDTQKHDRGLMRKFIAAAIDAGVYFHDYGGFCAHHGFCAATTLADADEMLNRLEKALRSYAGR